MPTFTGKRGELSRSKEQILDSGGLVPKLALNTHDGGFWGFIKCQNKVKGVLGCRCDKMDAAWMHYKAVAMMRGFALHPDYILSHTGNNSVGLLSWAGPSGQSYAGQQTMYTTLEMDVYSFLEGGEGHLVDVYRRLKIESEPTEKAQQQFKLHNVKFAMSKDMQVLAMIVKNDLEYSFFTPVLSANIVFGVVDEGGLQAPEGAVEKKLRMMQHLKPGTPLYEQMRKNLEEQEEKKAKPFLKILAQAEPLIFPKVVQDELPGFGPREPQPYRWLGVGRKEKVGR